MKYPFMYNNLFDLNHTWIIRKFLQTIQLQVLGVLVLGVGLLHDLDGHCLIGALVHSPIDIGVGATAYHLFDLILIHPIITIIHTSTLYLSSQYLIEYPILWDI